MIYRRDDEDFNNRPLKTKKGEIVKSKGEKEIADLLYSVFDIPYEYEYEFMGVRPDFTVYASSGKIIIWEFIGPGMINHDEYFPKLMYKFRLYQYLNPYIHQVIFSDDSTPNEEIINQWIIQPRQESFLTNLPQFFVDKLRESINKSKGYYANIESSTSLAKGTLGKLIPPPSSRYNREYWVIDSSRLSSFFCGGDDENWHYVTSFRNSMSSIKFFPESENTVMLLNEVWRVILNETPILCWVDLTSKNCERYSRYAWTEEESHKIIKQLEKQFSITDRGILPEIIFNVIASRPSHRSQIRILVDTSEIEYEPLENPYQHLKSVEQKTIRRPKKDRRDIGKQQKNKILDFQIIFDDDANYVDVFSFADIDIETHLREIIVMKRSYCSETKKWTLKPEVERRQQVREKARENRKPRNVRNNPRFRASSIDEDLKEKVAQALKKSAKNLETEG